MLPGPGLGPSPCFIAFSTRGCRISEGIGWPAASGGHIDGDAQAVSETRFLDIQVGPQKLHLLAEGGHGAAGVRQHVPEYAGQAQRHGFGARRIPHDQVGDGIQRIEQEMRIDLGPQGAQFGLRHLLQEQRLAALALDCLAFAMQGVQAIAELRTRWSARS